MDNFISLDGRDYEADMVCEAAVQYLAGKLTNDNPTMSSPVITRKFVRLKLAQLEHEEFAVLFLNTRHQLIEFRSMFRGTIDAASVWPREILKAVLQVNASAVILAHNHPSGNAEPSRADRAITRRLIEALSLIDVRVLDHLVVGSDETVSFAERGLI